MSVMSCPSPMPGPRMAARLKVGPPHKSILRPLGYLANCSRWWRVHQAQAEVPGVTDLPDKLETTLTVRLAGEQRKLYAAHEQRLRMQLEHSEEADFNTSKIRILAELTKLRQICCDPSCCTPMPRINRPSLPPSPTGGNLCERRQEGADLLPVHQLP